MLNFTNRRISPRCLLIYVLSVFFAIAIFGGCSFESQGPQYEIFPPVRGKGAIVVVVSGFAGTDLFRDFSSKLAELGYYTVLMDGKYLIDLMGTIVPGAENLQTVIADSKSSPQAIPGKVSLVGFSIGGAGVLSYGAKLKDQVSAVVAYYPAKHLIFFFSHCPHNLFNRPAEHFTHQAYIHPGNEDFSITILIYSNSAGHHR